MKNTKKTTFIIDPNGPTLEEERALVRSGLQRIAGVDEAGRGAWAGPLVAAAAILPLPEAGADDESWIRLSLLFKGVNDSKLLTPARRDELFELVSAEAKVGIGIVSSHTIDLIGLGAANKLAMALAVKNLPEAPQHLLIDAFRLPQILLPQTPLIKGDARSLSIAAASIVAKVTRDRLLCSLQKDYPVYGFERHKGYGTRQHSSALLDIGPCTQHRFSYIPVWEIYEKKAGSFEN